jgi:hypothetical protein
MSFAGHVFDMIARMKANQRRKRNPFDKDVAVQGRVIRQDYLREAPAEELQRIRSEMTTQQVRERRVRGWLLLLTTVLVAALMYWALHQEWQLGRWSAY